MSEMELVNLPEEEILTLRSDYTARTDDKILVVHYNIKSERQDMFSSAYVGDITDVQKVV